MSPSRVVANGCAVAAFGVAMLWACVVLTVVVWETLR